MRERIREIEKKNSNTKKFLVVGIASLLFIGLVAAAWFFEYDKEVTGEIVATGKKLHLIFDFTNFSINTSTGELNYSQNLTIDNKKDPRNVVFLIDVNKTLTEPGCPNYENDCNVEFFNTTGEVVNGTNYIIPKGLLYYYLNTSCVPYSCGQNISVHIEIKET